MSDVIIKRDVVLEWKEHPVSLSALRAAIQQVAPSCTGLSADVNLRVHLTEDDAEQVAAVEALWEECDDPEHALCAAYQSQADQEAAKQAAKQSAKTKLAALGLSEAEIAALVG